MYEALPALSDSWYKLNNELRQAIRLQIQGEEECVMTDNASSSDTHRVKRAYLTASNLLQDDGVPQTMR
uniref:Uncharacterized protein n=1 Tax=Peronospora matthiolae TaxID=2874970 RepID=A0AAV1URK5_9STRA